MFGEQSRLNVIVSYDVHGARSVLIAKSTALLFRTEVRPVVFQGSVPVSSLMLRWEGWAIHPHST